MREALPPRCSPHPYSHVKPKTPLSANTEVEGRDYVETQVLRHSTCASATGGHDNGDQFAGRNYNGIAYSGAKSSAPSGHPKMNMDETGRPDASGQLTAKPANANGTHDLKPFADQLMAIAQQLRAGEFDTAPAKPAEVAFTPGETASDATDLANQRMEYAKLARKAYATRRKREGIFGQVELFGEPAWDILLDLYVAFVEEKSVSVSSACIGSAAPPTTGLRWLGVLAENDLIAREPDPEDQRRVMVQLTEHGIEIMDRYFASVSSSS